MTDTSVIVHCVFELPSFAGRTRPVKTFCLGSRPRQRGEHAAQCVWPDYATIANGGDSIIGAGRREVKRQPIFRPGGLMPIPKNKGGPEPTLEANQFKNRPTKDNSTATV